MSKPLATPYPPDSNDDAPRDATFGDVVDVVVTVPVRSSPEQWGLPRVMVAELAKILDGTTELDLFEPLDTGVWITIDVDTVRSIYQQYRP